MEKVKLLIHLLHTSGHTITYKKVEPIETSITEQNILRFEDNEFNLIPDAPDPGHFVEFTIGNKDILEEALDGKRTFRGT